MLNAKFENRNFWSVLSFLVEYRIKTKNLTWKLKLVFGILLCIKLNYICEGTFQQQQNQGGGGIDVRGTNATENRRL